MNKYIKVIGILLFVLLLASCITTGKIEEEEEEEDYPEFIEENGFLIRGKTKKTTKLAKNDVISFTKTVKNPVYFEFSDWSKIRLTVDFLDELQLHKELTNSQKYKLMCYLFDNLPKNAPDGIAREVRLGQFFYSGEDEDRNLIIRVGLVTPASDASVNSERLIVLCTNAVKSQTNSKEVLRTSGTFYSYDANATVTASYWNGLLTNVKFNNAKKNDSVNFYRLEGTDTVNFAQALLNDEKLENDILAHNLVLSYVNDPDLVPGLKISAMLVEYNYRIAKGNVNGARDMWNNILALAEEGAGENMTKGNLEAVNGAYLYLLRTIKRS